MTGLASPDQTDLCLNATGEQQRGSQQKRGGQDSQRAEPAGQLDPQSLVVQSIGVLIGGPSFIAGKLP